MKTKRSAWRSSCIRAIVGRGVKMPQEGGKMTFSDTLQAQLMDAMAQAQHENLFIYLILHMILGCRKDNRALATMAGLVTRCGEDMQIERAAATNGKRGH